MHAAAGRGDGAPRPVAERVALCRTAACAYEVTPLLALRAHACVVSRDQFRWAATRARAAHAQGLLPVHACKQAHMPACMCSWGAQDFESLKEGPSEGVFVYGLYLDGCAWSTRENKMVDSEPKKLYNLLPVLFVTGVLVSGSHKRDMASHSAAWLVGPPISASIRALGRVPILRHRPLLLKSCVATVILLTLLRYRRMREVGKQGKSGFHCPWLEGPTSPGSAFIRYCTHQINL